MFEKAIWNDAIGWTEKAIGTIPRFLLFVFMHLFLGFGSIFVFSLASYRIFGNYFHPFQVLLFLGMIGLPVMYLSVLRRLILELKDQKEKN